MSEHAIEPFHFDGHGVNDAEGKRLAKLSGNAIPAHTHDDSGMPHRNADFDNLGELLASAPEMRDALLECKHYLANLEPMTFQGTRQLEDLLTRITALTSTAGAYGFVKNGA